MWKAITLGTIFTAALMLQSEIVVAKNVQVGIKGNNWSIGRIQGICAKQGGEFYSKGDEYGCSKDCKGGTCGVSCKGGSTGGQCVGSVPIPRLAPGGKFYVPVRPRGILLGPR